VPIVAVTVPWPQIRIPDAITLIPNIWDEGTLLLTLGTLANWIEVANLPDPEGAGVGVAVGDALGDGDMLADGLTVGDALATDELVAAEVEVLVPWLDELCWFEEVQPATKITATTVATTNRERRLFLMLIAQIAY
jgi:hypothetical protein